MKMINPVTRIENPDAAAGPWRRTLAVLVLLGMIVPFLASCDQNGNNASSGDATPTSTGTGDVASTTPAATPAGGQLREQDAATAAVNGPLPPIEVSPAVLNFGTLRPNQVVNGSVQLKNLGKRPLRIITSRASCQCTAVDLSDVIIEPGESIPLEATFDAGDTLGNRSAAVRIMFEGGYQLLEVAIAAKVTFAVQADPAHIDAQQVLVGEFDVTSEDGKPFSILAVNNQPPSFVGFDPATDAPRSEYVLRWDLTGYNPQTCLDRNGDRLPEYLAIETDHPDCRIFDVQVRHHCTRPQIPTDRNWVLPGSRALVGHLERGETGEFELTLVWIRGASPDDSIYEVTSSNPEQFEAELIGSKRVGNDITCRVRIAPNASHQGLIYGTVLFHSTRHSAPYLVIGSVEG